MADKQTLLAFLEAHCGSTKWNTDKIDCWVIPTGTMTHSEALKLEQRLDRIGSGSVISSGKELSVVNYVGNTLITKALVSEFDDKKAAKLEAILTEHYELLARIERQRSALTQFSGKSCEVFDDQVKHGSGRHFVLPYFRTTHIDRALMQQGHDPVTVINQTFGTKLESIESDNAYRIAVPDSYINDFLNMVDGLGGTKAASLRHALNDPMDFVRAAAGRTGVELKAVVRQMMGSTPQKGPARK